MKETLKKSILDMAMGGITERADYEMAKIIDNIMDVNTKSTGKRTLTLSIEFTPDDDRQMIAVKTTVKSKLEPTNPVSTSLYVGGDENGEVQVYEMVPQIPGQQQLDGDEQQSPAILKIIKTA